MKVPSWLSWFGSKRAPKEQRGYFMSTAGQSQERLGRIGLPTGEKGIVDRGKLVIPKGEEEGLQGYSADPQLEWVIDIALVGGREFAKADLIKVFDREWREGNSGVWVYGFAVTSGRWTFLSYDDKPEKYGRLQLGIGLSELESEISVERLTEIVRGVEEAMKRQRLSVALREAEPVGSAVEKAKRLQAIRNEWGLDILFVLRGGRSAVLGLDVESAGVFLSGGDQGGQASFP